MHKPALKISLLIILLAFYAKAVAQKTDKVFLKNGDVFTGEIYNMKFGQVDFNMTSTGTIKIKWDEVINVSSDKMYEVTLLHGKVFVTKLDSISFEEHHITLDNIGEIIRIKDKFLQSLIGSISMGFNYAKSNDILQFNFNSTATYVRPTLETSLLINSILSKSSSDTSLSKNQEVFLSILKQLKHNYYLTSSLGWQQNTQLGILNRFLLSGGGGKILISDNHSRMLAGTGLSYNLEESDQTNVYTSNLEALFTIQYKKFRYLTPKVSIDASCIFYTGLTDWGRVRMNINLTSKYEIFKDFNIGLTFYDNYDNRPPAGAISENDFGINFTLGYEFGK